MAGRPVEPVSYGDTIAVITDRTSGPDTVAVSGTGISYVLWQSSPDSPITIAGHNGPGGAVVIPNTINDLRVACIGPWAFYLCSGLTSVRIPDTVTLIEAGAFQNCGSLAGIVIGAGVTNIGQGAFSDCFNLTAVYFRGNAPSVAEDTFTRADQAIVYYLPGTTNWGSTFGGRPALLWNPQVQRDACFGVLTNQFGFTIAGSSNLVLVVEACTDLLQSAWFPVGTNTLIDGAAYFSDPQWPGNRVRFYRIHWPW